MKIAIGSDHAGYQLKGQILAWLREHGATCLDLGPDKFDPQDDYPDFASAVARAVAKGECELGIAICGTGVGSCIAANKVAGARAALCTDSFCARHSRLHNNANVLCLGERVVGVGLALEIVEAWINTPFSGDDRHKRRLDKVAALETQAED